MTKRTTWKDFKAEHPLTPEGRAAYEDEARISTFGNLSIGSAPKRI